jgi:uncharacterized pyridoxamine 5'-phosphate oxidase family protein
VLQEHDNRLILTVCELIHEEEIKGEVLNIMLTTAYNFKRMMRKWASLILSYFERIYFCGLKVHEKFEEFRKNNESFWMYLSGIDVDTVNGLFHYDCIIIVRQ